MAAEPTDLGTAVADVVDKTTLLVREEIELAKTEMTEKVTKLIKGAVIAVVAGVFAVFGLIYLLHALAWGIYSVWGSVDVWVGFLIVAVLIFALGGLAGFLAFRFIKGGAPPTPQMAIEEAQLIKATLQAGERGAAVERQRQQVEAR